jgi:gamma-glutamyltranspeptidase/glutathione hydrolase
VSVGNDPSNTRPRLGSARQIEPKASAAASGRRPGAGLLRLSLACTLLGLLATLLAGTSACAAGTASPAVRRASSPPPASTSPPAGAVASDEEAATAVGLALLAAGGNAIDAAVGTALALAVVHPEAGNLAGGGFAVLRLADGTVASLDFRETAPAGATPTMYLDAGGRARPEASTVGPLASGVPGSPTGYHELHRRFGRLPWAQVAAPAVRLARDGFALSARSALRLAEARDRLARFPTSAATWLPAGRPPGAGERIRLPALAETLAAYATDGPRAITEGPVASAVVAASAAHGGILTPADLAGYTPIWRPALRTQALGWELATMPLPSSGGVLLAGMLGLLERLGYQELPVDGVDRAHLFAEAARRVYADRFLLGDPATTAARVEELLAPAWLDHRAASIVRGAAIPSAMIAAWPDGPRPPSPPPAVEPNDTTHVSVIDGEGNAVALTTTLNDLFGCALWVPEVGFLNNEMDDFATAPGQPNLYGLIQGEANAVGAGKRMLSSMTPTVAWREGRLIAIGGRGGSRIPTGTVQVLLRLFAGESAEAAVARPRLHHQWLPDRLEIERGALDAATETELARRGHTVFRADTFPRVLVATREADGTLGAAGDPRGPAVGRVLPAGTSGAASP